MKYEIIIPIAESDYDRCKTNIVYISRFIDNQYIYIIGKLGLKEKILDDFQSMKGVVNFIDENEIMPNLTFDRVFDYLRKYNAEKRAGWYFQQFIKLGYSSMCKYDYYLSWDADTIPIRKISMFNSGRPIFDIKNEYHKPYFDTMYNLLGLNKIISGSYISEHMIFNKK